MSHLHNFSFLIEDVIAGSAHPGRGEILEANLSELRDLGFGAIVTVCETPLESGPLDEHEFRSLHLDVSDFTAPTLEQIDAAMQFVGESAHDGEAVLIHCFAGMGRTGTLLACYLVSEGRSAGMAIEEVRRARPGSIEDPSQERVIHAWELHVRGSHKKAATP